MPSEAERQIGFVIRILQYIGWPFSILFVPYALFIIILSVYTFLTDSNAPYGTLFLGTLLFTLIASFFVAHLRVARKMKQRDSSARLAGIALSTLMLLGFPLFTLVGLLCLRKITLHYDSYCNET